MLATLRRLIARRDHAITSRTDLINHLLRTHGGTHYLEIGVRDRRHNFDKVHAELKHGVDPAPRRPVTHHMTSDDFFARGLASTYDVVFIDGLHLAHQVEKDVVNALSVLRPGGAIVLHDCNPLTADAQTDDYDGKKHWNGTVWKAWVKLRATRDDLAMSVVDIDEGCGVIRRGKQALLDAPPALEYSSLDYSYLVANRRHALNLVSVESFLAS
jgi:hypothetical protein